MLNDYVGRSVAEAAVSDSSSSVTLTYAGDVPSAAVLTFSDVQKMLRKLRDAGYSVRYLFAGELGKLRGRAHWHGNLFFRGNAPECVFDTEQYMWPFWPHGYAFFREGSPSGFAYACKYLLKADGSAKRPRPSRFPPLGYDFFMQRAADLVRAGLPLQDPSYQFANVQFQRKRRPRVYWLHGRMRELYVERYIDLWARDRGGLPPLTPIVEDALDRSAREENERDPLYLARRISLRNAARQEVFDIRQRLRQGDSPSEVGYLLLPPDSVLVAFADGSVELVKRGGVEWTGKSDGVESVVSALRRHGVSSSMYPGVRNWLHGIQ